MASDDENVVNLTEKDTNEAPAPKAAGAAKRRSMQQEYFPEIDADEVKKWMSPTIDNEENEKLNRQLKVCEIETIATDVPRVDGDGPTFEEDMPKEKRVEIEKKYAEDKKAYYEASGLKPLVLKDVGIRKSLPTSYVMRIRRNMSVGKNVKPEEFFMDVTKEELAYMKKGSSYISSVKHVKPNEDIVKKLTKHNTAFILRPHILNPKEEPEKQNVAFFPRLHVLRVRLISEAEGESKEEIKLNEAILVPAAEAMAWLDSIDRSKGDMKNVVSVYDMAPVEAYNLPIASSKSDNCKGYMQVVNDCNAPKTKPAAKRTATQMNEEAATSAGNKKTSSDAKKPKNKRKSDEKSKDSKDATDSAFGALDTHGGALPNTNMQTMGFPGFTVPTMVFPLHNHMAMQQAMKLLQQAMKAN